MKYDWKKLYRRWQSSGITKKEFAAQRGLSYGSLVVAFQKVSANEKKVPAKSVRNSELPAFSKVEVDSSSLDPCPRNLVIVTASGLRVEVPI